MYPHSCSMKRLLRANGWVIAAFFAIVVQPASAQQDNEISIGRYLTVSTQPAIEQSDVLSATVHVHFSAEVKTVGDAMMDFLRLSGYSLVEGSQQAPDLQNTLSKPLPLVHRELGPMPLREALKLLAGSAFDLTIDPLNRTINFQVKTEFQKESPGGRGL